MPLEEGKTKKTKRLTSNYTMVVGKLYKMGRFPLMLRCLGKNEITIVLMEVHTGCTDLILLDPLREYSIKEYWEANTWAEQKLPHEVIGHPKLALRPPRYPKQVALLDFELTLIYPLPSRCGK